MSVEAIEKRPALADTPTQKGPFGIRFDFNSGCRVELPEEGGPWRIRLRDLDTSNTIYQTNISKGRVHSAKKYFVRIGFDVRGRLGGVFSHFFDATDQDVLINFGDPTPGEAIGWMTYAARFQELHGCHLTCALSADLIPLFRDAYPEISFVLPEEVLAEQYYATYTIGLFGDDRSFTRQPCDFRLVGAHRIAGYILGVNPREQPPRIAFPGLSSRPESAPYVCISLDGPNQASLWNNPTGWSEVINYLIKQGYKIVRVEGDNIRSQEQLPVEVQTVNEQSIRERARWIRHSEFVVGVSNQISWLGWAVGAPVIMISGYSHPVSDFDNPLRLTNYHPCNSCRNDPGINPGILSANACPRHGGTIREFECTRFITANQVKTAIRYLEQRRSSPYHSSFVPSVRG